jgi:agmatine/peptidylarginine deiminase
VNFSDLFMAWFERQPQWKQDQIQASFRDMHEAVAKMSALIEMWEQQGVAAAEEYANEETP